MDYSALLSGSPLIPLDILVAFFAALLAIILATFTLIHFRQKQTPLLHRLKLTTLVLGLVFTTLTLAGLSLGLFWLVPSPHVVKTDPAGGESDYPTGRKIEIVFDRPVSRAVLEKSISPDVPGVWVFENSTYRTHLMRRVVFYPLENLQPATEYTVKLKNITNVIRRSAPTDFELKFTTQTSPTISRVIPANNQKDVSIDSAISVFLTAPDGQLSQFEFALSPQVDLAVSLDPTKTFYTLKPKEPLRQGARYQLKIAKSDIRRNLTTNHIVETGQRQLVYSGYFTTPLPVGIDSLAPSGDAVASSQPITIRFSEEMDERSVLDNFSVTPPVTGSALLIDHVIFVFTPTRYDYATTYTIKLAKGTKSLDGSSLDSDFVSSFTTLGEVEIADTFPKNGATGITPKTPLTITFDQEVDQKSAQTHFSLSPPTTGKITWEGKTLTFTPATAWRQDTLYTVTLASGIKSREGLDSTKDQTFTFSTVESVFRLPVPVFLQQHPLSCEIASLRMALAYRQVDKTEEELLAEVGYDPSPRRNNLWGNPYEVFVGDIDGKQMTTGYGVYWPPIARAAGRYRAASEFSGSSVPTILKHVAEDNPVIIWTYSKGGIPTYWFTTAGERIFAASGEHSVAVVGFVGPVDSPSQIIVNDPLLGQLYWTLEEFTKRIAVFGNSGVVVY